MDIQGVEQVQPLTAHKRQREGALLVDVRESIERRAASIEGSHWIPLTAFGQRWQELPKDRPIILFCAAGARSQQAAVFLKAHGRDVANLEGGIHAWAMDGLPTPPGQPTPPDA